MSYIHLWASINPAEIYGIWVALWLSPDPWKMGKTWFLKPVILRLHPATALLRRPPPRTLPRTKTAIGRSVTQPTVGTAFASHAGGWEDFARTLVTWISSPNVSAPLPTAHPATSISNWLRASLLRSTVTPRQSTTCPTVCPEKLPVTSRSRRLVALGWPWRWPLVNWLRLPYRDERRRVRYDDDDVIGLSKRSPPLLCSPFTSSTSVSSLLLRVAHCVGSQFLSNCSAYGPCLQRSQTGVVNTWNDALLAAYHHESGGLFAGIQGLEWSDSDLGHLPLCDVAASHSADAGIAHSLFGAEEGGWSRTARRDQGRIQVVATRTTWVLARPSLHCFDLCDATSADRWAAFSPVFQ